MSVSYNYDRRHMPHQDSSSSYDQGYNSQPQHYSHSVASDGFSDISFDPYNSKQTTPQYYGYNTNNVFSPDDSRRKFDVQRLPLKDDRVRTHGSSADSDVYSNHRPPSYVSSVGRDADIESIASHRTQSTVTSYGIDSNASMYDQYRYNGELYRPVAAPRKVNSEVKRLFGEIHPRMLRPEEKPIVESGEETEDSMSIGSAIIPRAAPRASMRRSKTVNFIEEEAMRMENASLNSILKTASMPARLDSYGNKRIVRFAHVDKYADSKPRRDMTDYSDVDSDHGGKSRKKSKQKQKDIWSHVAPVGPKPARNARSSSQNSSSKDRRRSSSADRSRQQQRSGSRTRSSSASSISKRGQQSPSMQRKPSRSSTQSQKNGRNGHARSDSDADVDGQVVINMPDKSKKGNSMITDIQRSERGNSICSDSQKLCKWVLIIGVPVCLLVIVCVVVGVMFGNSN